MQCENTLPSIYPLQWTLNWHWLYHWVYGKLYYCLLQYYKHMHWQKCFQACRALVNGWHIYYYINLRSTIMYFSIKLSQMKQTSSWEPRISVAIYKQFHVEQFSNTFVIKYKNAFEQHHFTPFQFYELVFYPVNNKQEVYGNRPRNRTNVF